MAEVNTATFINRYNNGTTGLFKDNITGDIEAADTRDLVQYLADSFLNFLDDVLDEDSMTSNSATQVPTQQSVKAYADTKWPLGGTADLTNDVTIDGNGNLLDFINLGGISFDVGVNNFELLGSVFSATLDSQIVWEIDDGVDQSIFDLSPSVFTITVPSASLNLSTALDFSVDDGVDASSFSLTPTLASIDVPLQLPSYTVAGLPSASPESQIAYCSNESGGKIVIFSDGTDWRRVTDGSVVS